MSPLSATRALKKEIVFMKIPARYLTFALLALTLALPVSSAEAQPARPLTPGDGAEAYLQELEQMNTAECGKCHMEIFKTIRDKGGQHQLECRECHHKFHTFTPGVAWEDRVPGCNECHAGVHDDAYTECLSCHQQAHAPIASLVGGDKLAAECGRCHASVAGLMAAHPSGHGALTCNDCHSQQHGYKPGCNDCHPEPHTPFQDNAACVTCHEPHKPLVIAYNDQVPNSLCVGCHGEPAKLMADSRKAHGELSCVFCHAETHGMVPTCQQCHENGPHNPELLKDFQGCTECHGDPHALSLSNP